MKHTWTSTIGLMLGIAVSCLGHNAQGADELLPMAAKAVSYSAIAQTASLDAQGVLRGQVRTLSADSPSLIEPMQLTVVAPNGSAVTATTDANGMFAVAGSGSGVYSIMGRNAKTVISQAIRVYAQGTVSDGPLQLYALSQFDSEIERALSAPTTAGYPPAADASLETTPAPVSMTGGRVQLTSQGTLLGQMWSQRDGLAGTAITVYQNGLVVRRALANSKGEFELPLTAGIYGVVATGSAGHAALSFEAVAASAGFSTANVPSNVRFIALAVQQNAGGLGFGLSGTPLPPPQPPVDPTLANPTVVLPPQPVLRTTMSGFRGGVVGGGGGGVGGGGAGGGGLGGSGLLGIGGLAVGVVALSSDNGDNNVPIVSPSGQ